MDTDIIDLTEIQTAPNRRTACDALARAVQALMDAAEMSPVKYQRGDHAFDLLSSARDIFYHDAQ